MQVSLSRLKVNHQYAQSFHVIMLPKWLSWNAITSCWCLQVKKNDIKVTRHMIDSFFLQTRCSRLTLLMRWILPKAHVIRIVPMKWLRMSIFSKLDSATTRIWWYTRRKRVQAVCLLHWNLCAICVMPRVKSCLHNAQACFQVVDQVRHGSSFTRYDRKPMSERQSILKEENNIIGILCWC